MANSTIKLIYILLSFFIFQAPKEATGLSIKLIHPHSIESPFYPGNITRTERIKLLLQSSPSIKATILKQSANNASAVRLIMESQGLQYMIQAGIGTFNPPLPPHINYLLHLDTGNDLTWTQCNECLKRGRSSCFQQKPPLFPSARSASFRHLPCGRHKLCIPGKCMGPMCSYNIKYADGARSMGYLAGESFTFASDGNKTERVTDTVFGCGIKNTGFMESSKDNLVAGNFGLGPGHFSFLMQKKLLTGGRFSYCLPRFDAAHKSTVFLRFGSDIPQRKDLKETPLMDSRGFPFYFIQLKGISIGNTSLNIPKHMLVQRDWNRGGCIVDSGSSMTFLPPSIYKIMRSSLIRNHFSRYKPVKNLGHFKSCYLFPPKTRLKHLPDITFHLQDSDLVFPPHLGFLTDQASGRKFFCLAMNSVDINGMVVIGAFQQANTRYVFDTEKRKLYFGPEHCSDGA